MVTKKYWLGCLLILTFLVLVAGCGGYERMGSNKNPNNPANSADPKVRAKQNNPADQLLQNPSNVAAHLESLAMKVPHVRSARCVVLGNTAVVGIDVDADLERSKVGTIKYSVAEALRKDPYGVNSIVTADIDINQRLSEIRDSVMAGRPFSGFASEMADIVSRIMPQLPGDIIQGGDTIQNNAGNSGAGNTQNNTGTPNPAQTPAQQSHVPNVP